MKLNDFLQLNHQIGELVLEIRDYSNGGARLVETYKVGSHVREDRVKAGTKPRWITIAKPINKIEDVYKTGNAFWGIKTAAIPKRLLEMDVMNFVIGSRAFVLNNGLWELLTLRVCLKGNDTDALALAKEKAEQENSDLDENGQLKGQMSFL